MLVFDGDSQRIWWLGESQEACHAKIRGIEGVSSWIKVPLNIGEIKLS